MVLGIALSDLEVLEHSAVQKVADTSHGVRAQISMVEGIEEIFSEFDLAFMERRLQPCHPKSAFYSPQGFLGAGVFAGQGERGPVFLRGGWAVSLFFQQLAVDVVRLEGWAFFDGGSGKVPSY